MNAYRNTYPTPGDWAPAIELASFPGCPGSHPSGIKAAAARRGIVKLHWKSSPSGRKPRASTDQVWCDGRGPSRLATSTLHSAEGRFFWGFGGHVYCCFLIVCYSQS
jgi:hypothetical protein